MKTAYKLVIPIVLVSLAIFAVLVTVNTAEAAFYPAARVIVLSEDSDVTVTFQLSEAACNNLYGLWSPVRKDLGWGHSTTPGTVFNLGKFPAGTELIFFIYHPCSGNTWLNGPGERNGDGQVHAAISDVGFQTWRVGFEDLPGGGDRDFNDIILIVKGDLYIAPPYNRPPVANANGPYVGYEGSVINFDASNSTDPDGNPLTYRWDFDNDGTWDTGWSSSPTASYTWSDDWSGTAKLGVSDGELTALDTASVTVNNVPPTPYWGSHSVNGVYPAPPYPEGLDILFDSTVVDPGTCDTFTYDWDFGDGTVLLNAGTPVTHAWGDNGVYTVTLTVTDDDGGVGIDNIPLITVSNVAPTAEAGPDQTVNEGDTVSFSGSFIDPGWLDTHTIAWDFGDGGTAVGTLTSSHAYGDNGIYTVTLTVTDDDGGIGNDALTVIVNNVAPTVSIDSVEQPNPYFILPVVHTLTFTGSFTDPGWLDTHTATWDFGDGTVVTGTLSEENIPPDSTGVTTAAHAYSSPGTYTIVLTVTDDDGDIGTATTTLKVMTAEEVKHIINDYIQNLPESAFDGPAVQRKNAFANKFSAADEQLQAGNYNGVIQKLQNDIRAKADGYVDGNPKNDWVIDPEAQKAICQMIDDLIVYLTTLL